MDSSALRLSLLRVVAALARPPSAPPGQRIDRLLVVRPDHLGDLLFITPTLRLLRRELPETRITALVGPWGKPVLAGNPNVDEVITWDFPYFNRRPGGSLLGPYVSLWRLARLVRRGRFDAALVLRFDFWWGAMAGHLAGIPRKVGYVTPETRPFLTEGLPRLGARHEVERNLDLARALVGNPSAVGGPLEFSTSAQDEEQAERLLRERGAHRAPLIVVHPGAGSALKLWTPDGFAAVADALAGRCTATIALTGTPSEMALAQAIAERARCKPIVLAGDLGLGTLGAIFRRCALVVGVDSGALHMAVAVGTPSVHLYGPIDHLAFGPYGDPKRHAVVRSGVRCSPCCRLDYCAAAVKRECMLAITPDMVIQAAQGVLA